MIIGLSHNSMLYDTIEANVIDKGDIDDRTVSTEKLLSNVVISVASLTINLLLIQLHFTSVELHIDFS